MIHATAPVPPAATTTFGDCDYDHDRLIGRVDGVEVPVETEFDRAAPEIGILTGQWFASLDIAAARLVDRAEWDAAHPGVEPTDEAMRAVVTAARLKIEQAAEDQADDAAAEDAFDAPDDDGYEGEDY